MAGVPYWIWYLLLFSIYLRYAASQSDSLFLLVDKVEGTSNQNTSNETEQCTVGTEKLHCLCGDDLRDSYNRYREELVKTCSSYEVIRDNSQLSFCEDVFLDLGYRIQVRNLSSVEDTSNITEVFSNSSSLSDEIRSLEGNLEGFKRVLDRTIIGVLIDTEEDRCFCLDNYKKWLCTMLPVYTSASSSVVDEGGNLSSVIQLRPCLSVCHRVLQSCPYYLPSQFQLTAEVIYGGYPAFDCPRDPEPDYASIDSKICIGDNGGLLHGSAGMVIMASLTLYFLAVWSVT